MRWESYTWVDRENLYGNLVGQHEKNEEVERPTLDDIIKMHRK
jgi:hypothetical protein